MIFSARQGMYQRTLLSEKILTSRLKLPAHIAVGKTWAIVPRRAAGAWWISNHLIQNDELVVTDTREWAFRYGLYASPMEPTCHDIAQCLMIEHYTQSAIVIDAFWQTPLQEMTRREAINEGFPSIEVFQQTWHAINPAKAHSWTANPLVWRIAYHTPLAVNEAVRRVGKQAIMDAGKLYERAEAA